jgi:glycosyltransferase involved in cell wall biosynthesis
LPDKLLVFIPCYNCAPQIPRVLRQFTDSRVAGRFDEILVLDNNSSDGTREAAVEAARTHLSAAAVTVGKNRDNYNLGGSHKTAFRYALAHGFSHVVVLHGDDQGAIRDLLPVLDSAEHRAMDACLGARFMRGSRLSGYSAFRIFGNRVFNGLFSLRMGTAVKDLGSGLNIFGRAVLEDERVIRYADDLRFNVYLLLGLHARRLRFKYFPISWREDDQISNVKMMSQAMRTLALLWESGAGERFWSADHRAVRHAAYEFDPVYRSG